MNARSYRMDHSAHLQTLRNVFTGRYIQNFPNTFSELDALDSEYLLSMEYILALTKYSS